MAGTTQEDDLIILTDDVQTESPEMVINLDEDTNESKDEDIVLTFDDAQSGNKPEASDVVESVSTQEATVGDDSHSDGLDFGDLVLDSHVGETVHSDEKIEEIKDSGDMLDFSSISEGVSDENQEKEIEVTTNDSQKNVSFMEDQLTDNTSSIGATESIASVGDMESILDDTITKLETRQGVIHTEEEKQEGEINHLETQIKQLESKKQEALKKNIDLQAEDKKIKSNITQLDKMKATTEEKPTPKLKK